MLHCPGARAHHPHRVIPAHPRGSDNRSVVDSANKPARAEGKAPARGRREQARTIAAVGLGGLAAAFAVLNVDEVEVNWILGTWSTPLIIVIALSILLGAALGFLLGRRRGSS